MRSDKLISSDKHSVGELQIMRTEDKLHDAYLHPDLPEVAVPALAPGLGVRDDHVHLRIIFSIVEQTEIYSPFSPPAAACPTP